MEMPKYLFSKKFLTDSVAIIFLFSIIFMLVYRPFSATSWLGFRTLGASVHTILFYLSCIVLMSLSKFAVYRFQLRHTLTVWRFVIWVMMEYVAVAAVYVSFSSHVLEGHLALSFPVMFRTVVCVGLILIIPYSFMSLYAAYSAQKEELEMLRLRLNSSESPCQSVDTICLYDYKGDPAMTVPQSSIYYMEAQDNYVQVIYESEGRMLRYMLRCPTQKIEETIEGSALVRCHRSCIVNLDHLKQFRRGHNHATIVLDRPDLKEIPVSKSYYKRTLGRLVELNPSADQLIMRT